MADRACFVYVLASPSRTLYIGVTRDLYRRLEQHRSGAGGAFTRRYGVHRLVHVERFERPLDAIAREKQIKGWRRERKVELIERANPLWKDLAAPGIAGSFAFGSG